MSNNKCVYYKEKEQKSIDGGITWVDTGNFRKGALISTQASQCGSFTTEYRWVKADYVCDNANKYKGYKQQVSHDNGGSWVDTGVVDIGSLIESNSRDCGYDEQWFVLTGDSDFICDGAAKYKKKEMKYTRNSGTTWNSFVPPKYEKGDLIEETSTDCASMKVTYVDGTTKYFSNLTSIEKDTVGNRGTVKEVEIYDGVTSIGYEAFDGYYKLTSIKIPNSVTSIGASAFHKCLSLTSITIPDSVKRIDAYTFSDCTGLNNVTIGNGVTNIGEGAFASCSGLTKVTIPEGVTNIGKYAFNRCSGLTSITIPDSVKTIDYHAFYSCKSLRTMTVNATTPPTLGKDAIPNNIQRIYVPASSVNTYKSASGWSDYADKIWAIGYDEQWFVLTGDKDFICEEGSKYKKKEMKYTRNSGTTWNSFNPPKFEKGDLIESNSKDCPFPSMKVTYTDGTENTLYNVTSIDNMNYDNIKNVEIYAGVKYIEMEAFEDCDALETVTIHNSLNGIGIGAQAFKDCHKLTSVTMPSAKNIGDYAFYYCTGLTSVIIGNNVKKIGGWAFQFCNSMRDITLPNTLTSIGDYAFSYCHNFTSISIPDSVTSIGQYAFEDCYRVTSIVIGSGITSIANNTFQYCKSISSVTIKNSSSKIPYGYESFEGISSSAKLYVPSNLLADYQADSSWTGAFGGGIYAIPQ